MGTINFSVSTSETETGSAISVASSHIATSDRTIRETIKVADTEVPISFSEVAPSILVLRVLNIANPQDGDSTKPLLWGYTTGVYEHELYVGEPSVIRLRAGGPVTGMFLITGDVGPPVTEFWVEYQVWDQ